MSAAAIRTGVGAEAAVPMPVARSLFGLRLDELARVVEAMGEKPYRAKQIFEALYKQRVASVEDMTVLSAAFRARLISDGWQIGLPEMAQTAVSVDGTERYLMRMADGETVETVWMPDGDGGERGDGSEAASEEADEVVDPQEAVGGGRGANAAISPLRASRSGRDDRFLQGAGENADSSAALRNDKSNGYWAKRGEGRPRTNFGTLAATGFRRATICISSQVGCAVNCQFCLTAKLGIRRNLTAGEIAGQVAAVLNRHKIQIGKDRINLVFMGMGEPFF